jgi:23S rRNA (cytidine2498-2'-O)-methyltransferase
MAYSLQPKKLPLNFTVLIPFIKFTEELERELLLLNIKTLFANEHFIIVDTCSETPIWCQAALKNCRVQEIESKNNAVQYLKKQPVRGVYFETSLSPKLGPAINSELRALKLKRLKFEVPSAFNFKYFVWGMLDANHLFVCDEPSNQFPLGWHEFDENKDFPPNRAYLKLWELLTLGHITLNDRDIAVDLGASPGGWSWVLSRQVKKVYSVDRDHLK